MPDSSSTAFAMYSGVKTTGYTMGYDSSVGYLDPGSASNATAVSTVLDWAQAAGKRTGFVTTTRMSHATPAALYSRTVSRFWECDKEIQKSVEKGHVTQDEVDRYKPQDITAQLVDGALGQGLDILLGGGLASWLPQPDQPEIRAGWDYDTDEWDCYRQDNRTLTAEWLDKHPGGVFVQTRTDLMNLSLEEEAVLGIFTNSYLTWDHLVNDTNEKPRLEDLAVQAVRFLQEKSRDEEGFFVMIEAGRIDAAVRNL